MSARALTELERAGSLELPEAAALSGRFPLTPNPAPAPAERYQEIMERLDFGNSFTDHMARATWTKDGGWSDFGVVPFENLSLSPAAAVFHYGQEIFEGLKAYRHADGSVWSFRPGYNGARLAASARRLSLPELAVEDFVASIVDLVRADERWVPAAPGSALYLRPFMIATEAFLGVDAAKECTYMVIASPVGPYFKAGLSGVSIWVTRDYHRAGPGGTGAAKCGGNYAASLLPQQIAKAKGHQQVCFLDVTGQYLEELGGMNVFVVMRDGTVRTPALTGTILEGGTRSAIITLLTEAGHTVVSEDIALSEVLDGIESGEVTEMFACGTAAVVTPISHLAGDGFAVDLPGREVTTWVYETLTGIQNGHLPDPHGWTYRIL